MSIVPKETIEVIAQRMGITNLSPEVALALAPDVEYRVREIMQEAIKCMRHSRRTILTADDVDSALSLRNVEPIYGFASGDPLRFKRAAGHKDLFYLDDKDVEFKDVIEASLPKAPLDTAVAVHWLAIEGVQPAIPENAPVEALVAPSESKKSEHGKDDGSPFDIKLPVKHVLSRELQLYFVKITELIINKSESDLFKKALISLSTDSGLHPLVPYFTYFIADEVSRNLNNLPLLFALMRVVRSLLHNQHIHIEPYLHQLMPSIITCLVAKILGKRTVDDHWELRNFAANIVCFVCKRFGHMYPNLQTRVTKTLINAFLDPAKALTQHYGAIQGLAALGPNVVRLLVLPNLEPYLKLLEPEMLLEKQKNEIKRHEAWRVYGALLHAAGLSLYERMKLLRGLLAPPIRSVWRVNGKILTNKRKTIADTPSQPPVKKQAVDGALGIVSGDFQQGNGDSFSNTSGEIRVGSSTAPGKMSVSNDGGVPSGSGRDRVDRRDGSKTSSRLLMQAWKDDLDAGHLLPSLYELFGEGILPFVPSPEMSLFV